MKKLILTLGLLSNLACTSKEASHTESAFKEKSEALTMQEIDLTSLPPLPDSALVEPVPLPPPPITGNDPTIPVKQNEASQLEKQLIKHVDVTFEDKNIKDSEQTIQKLTKQVRGVINYAEEQKNDIEIRQHLTIKVPAALVDTFLVMILKESVFTETKTITIEDVTKRYIDIEARVRSKKATENKYLELLKQAKNVADVLKVEEQLRFIREEIEVREAELRELKADVKMSNIRVNFYQKTTSPPREDDTMLNRLWQNLRDGFGFLGDSLLLLVYFLPVIVLVGTVAWIGRKWWKKRRIG